MTTLEPPPGRATLPEVRELRADNPTALRATELLENVRLGRPDSWEALVSEYERLVLAVPVRMGLCREDCEDVVQNTWLRLWGHVREIHQPGAMVKWILTTTWRCAQAVQAKRFAEEPVLESEPKEDTEDPGRICGAIEERQVVHDCIQQLGSPDMELVQLLLDEQPYAEIAKILDISVGAIGPMRIRAFEKLGRLLVRAHLE